MRPLQLLRKADNKKNQISIKQKTQKQAQTLKALMQLPDTDVSQFLQQLMKNHNYEQILDLIPEEKKIDFFTKNYKAYLDTQEELLQMKIPLLLQIPKAKEFHLKIKEDQKQQEDADESAVIQLIDSFCTYVLEKNNEEVMRVYNIILQMKGHSRYKSYFYSYSINKSFREAYSSFVENCKDVNILLKLNESNKAIKEYFESKETQIFEKINGDLKIDESVGSFKKTMSFLLGRIEKYSEQFGDMFKKELEKQPQLWIYLSKWINQLAITYYNSIQGLIYSHEEISEILKKLSEILETSRENESKGFSLYRQLRHHISQDLPVHLQKIIQVILQSFDDLSIYNHQLYEFIQVKSLTSIHQLIQMLNPITKQDYGKKCCSKKGILLINSFLIILLPLCDEKWSFLHQNILDKIIVKTKTLVEQKKAKLLMWDYYHLFSFFYQLSQGKVRHRVLFDIGNSSQLKEKTLKVKLLAEECRSVFQNELTQSFWQQILSEIPRLLWQFRKYAQLSQHSPGKPTIFSIDLVFRIQQFMKQLQFRISKQHLEYLGIQFYEYLIYVIEYILFWSYHDHGTNIKVFYLYKKEKILAKAKLFPIEELLEVKNREILKLSYFTKYGLERFVIDMYFLSDVYRTLINKSQKVKPDEFLEKVARILAKELKNQALQTDRKHYKQLLKQFLNVYETQPEVIRKYLNERKAASSSLVLKTQKAIREKEKSDLSSKQTQRQYID